MEQTSSKKEASMILMRLNGLPATTDNNAAFTAWIAEYCTAESLVLDIGAGRDRNGIDASLQPRIKHLVGIDPSENILANSGVHERHQSNLEDFAQGEQRRFDVLLTAWVLEHISDPLAFFTACRRLLKPGGMFFALTPNMWHYFGLVTKVCGRLGIEDWMLDRLMRAEQKAQYHFPTTYHVNSLRSIRHMLTHTGFQYVEFRCFDVPSGYNYVIPEPLRWFPRLYAHLVYRFNLLSLMGTIMFRARG
jgi:2-polyprenyl-3-methyl-5-hydroxy-6-metoxy-1,4-benzoquinol methylase